jgi:hypothetical protein
VSAGGALDVDLPLDGVVFYLNSSVHISGASHLTSLGLLFGLLLLFADGLTNFFMKLVGLLLNVLAELLGLGLSHC